MATGPAVLIPVKAFGHAKVRLVDALPAEDRAALAQSLAQAVVESCAPFDVYVASEDAAVRRWANELGATAVDCPDPGLNNVVRHGVAVLAGLGYNRVMVTHADLSDPTALPGLFELAGTVLVPDRRLDGTNVIVVPTAGRFAFSYGPASFARHLSEAERMGQPIHVVRDNGLSLDVDEPDDLDAHRLEVLRRSDAAAEDESPRGEQ